MLLLVTTTTTMMMIMDQYDFMSKAFERDNARCVIKAFILSKFVCGLSQQSTWMNNASQNAGQV